MEKCREIGIAREQTPYRLQEANKDAPLVASPGAELISTSRYTKCRPKDSKPFRGN